MNQKNKGAAIEKPLLVVQGCLEMLKTKILPLFNVEDKTSEQQWEDKQKEGLGSIQLSHLLE